MNRLQHLLKVEGFDGIRSINFESQCFQLDENGEIFRLVYLGVTDHELLIATQCLPNYKNVMEAAISYVDLELEGLKLISSIPLECIQFYVVDDRSRKFAVCTCLGVVQYFEVCNTPDGSDTAWLKWRELFSQRDNPLSCGYKRWRFMSSDQRCKNELEFIRRPFPFYCVESVGIQTTNKKGEILETISPNIQIKENKRQERLFKVTFPFIKTEPINCSVSQNNIHLDHATPSPKRSKSCSDLVDGRPISKTVYSYLVFSLVYQNLNGDRDKAKEEFLYLFSQWAEMEKIIHYYSQIVKYQTKNKQRSFSESVDVTDSESEESITDLIDGYKQNESSEKPLVNKNWLKLKEKIHENAKSNTKTTFAKTVEEVMFKMCDSKQKTKNFTSFKPNEFAAEILLMSSKLVACISYFDFMSLYYGKMERSVEDLISFFRNLSQLISTDVLRHTFTTGILKIMIFYIKVGEVCLAMGDYQTCRSVLLGLHSPRVHILTDDWDDLQSKYKEEYRLLIELSKRVLVPRNYMEHFKNHYGEEKTRLPLLDHLLRHAWEAHLPPDRFKNMLYPTLTIRARIKRRPSNSKLHRVKCSLTDLKKKVSKEKVKEDLTSEKRVFVKETKPCSSQKINSENDEQKATAVFSSQVNVADDFSNKIIQEALEIIRKDPSNLGSTIDGAKLNERSEDQYVSTNSKQIPELFGMKKMEKKIGQYERADSKDEIKAKVGAKEKNSLSENLENEPSGKESQNIKRLKGEPSEMKDQVKVGETGETGETEGERKVKDYLDKKEEMKRRKEVVLADKEKKDNIYEKKKAKEETGKLKKEKEKRSKDEKEKRKKKEKEQKDKKIKEKKEKEARDKTSKEEKKLKDDEKKKKAKKIGKGKMKYEAFEKREDMIEEELEDGIKNGDGSELEKDIDKTSMHSVSKENETEKSIPTGARDDKSQETKSDTTKKTTIRENINVENENFDSIASTSKSSSENIEDLDTRYITTRHRYSGDSGRRKSLFEEAADDENVLKIKEASIDEAVERKVKDVRRASIFDESYLDEVGEKDTKVAFKSALKSPTQPANEAKSNKRMSVFGSIFSSHGDASFVSSLFSAISKSASASSLGSKRSSDSVGKRKKSVRFEDSVSIARYNINASSDANVNYNKTMNNMNMCELCHGKCIYNADPFKEILKSQLLAVTYVNSQASRPALRRLIEEKLK